MGRLIFGVAFSLVLYGCYEIPPQLSTQRATESELTLIRAYGYAPFDVRNRWFQRAFLTLPGGGGAADGGPSSELQWRSSGPAEPLAPAGPYTAVDCAEMIALLAELESGIEPVDMSVDASVDAPVDAPVDARSAVAAILFHCDLLALAMAWTAGDDDLQQRARQETFSHARRTALDDAALSSLSVVPPPPPLRDDQWAEAAPELTAGLLPHSQDLRWTRIFRRSQTATGRAARLLVRLRVGLNQADGVELLPLASEAWLLEEQDAREDVHEAAHVWRFDREKWLRGSDPWREIEPDEEFSIRDPLREGVGWRTGTTATLCGGCHDGTAGRFAAPKLEADLKSQSRKIKDLLERRP